MKKAIFIKQIEAANGDMRLYRLKPKSFFLGLFLLFDCFVVVSAVEVFGMPETYIFEANYSGEITNWCELEGSFKGDLDHEKALNNFGYATS